VNEAAFLVGSHVRATRRIWNRYGVELNVGEEAEVVGRFPYDPSEKATVVDLRTVRKAVPYGCDILRDVALPENCLEPA
jgi:hypothetical protein